MVIDFIIRKKMKLFLKVMRIRMKMRIRMRIKIRIRIKTIISFLIQAGGPRLKDIRACGYTEVNLVVTPRFFRYIFR